MMNDLYHFNFWRIIMEANKQSSSVKTLHKPTSLVKDHNYHEMELMFDRMYDRLTNWFKFSNTNELELLKQDVIQVPKIDLIDKDGEITVRAEVPGIDRNDIDLSIEDNILCIKGRSTSETKEEDGKIHRREICTTSFNRTVFLPGVVSADNSKAKLKDGILEITFHKLKPKVRQSIKVN